MRNLWNEHIDRGDKMRLMGNIPAAISAYKRALGVGQRGRKHKLKEVMARLAECEHEWSRLA